MDAATWKAAGRSSLDHKWGKQDLSSAYVNKGEEPHYTFPVAIATSDAKDNNNIVWTSREHCKDTHKEKTFFTMTLNTVCKPKDPKVTTASPAAKFSAPVKVDACNWKMSVTHDSVCAVDIPISTAMNKLAPFFGILFLVFGFALCFFGTKWIDQFLGAIVGLVGAVVIFGLVATLVLKVDSETWLVAVVIVVSCALGFGIAYASFRILKSYSVSILGAMTGGFSFLTIATAASISKGWAVGLIVVVGAVIGFVFGTHDKVKNIIKNVSTAIIGSFLFVRGVGFYAPGYPNVFGMNAKSVA